MASFLPSSEFSDLKQHIELCASQLDNSVEGDCYADDDFDVDNNEVDGLDGSDVSDSDREQYSHNVYSKKHLLVRLKEKYGPHIYIGSLKGRKNVICFIDLVTHIVSDKWYDSQCDEDGSKAEKVVLAAATVIKAQLREMQHDMESYSTFDSFSKADDTYVPHLLVVSAMSC